MTQRYNAPTRHRLKKPYEDIPTGAIGALVAVGLAIAAPES